ncbi:alpha/beta fold hydrolase [Pseudonocardia sp. NPDC049635]|uniref:thioesterase II family protein n=1 Tax=Pseudonocardia sp. NPDC049635 TaxID=3155506 RepID=UPI0033E6567D
MTTSVSTDLWFRRFRAGDDNRAPRARLLCFPHAGGAASYFTGLSARLRPDVDVVAVQYPGRQDRRSEPFATDLATLADRIVEQLDVRTVADGLPLVLFGHSMGATVGYEVARRLEHAHERPVDRLVVSARNAPSEHRSAGIHRLDDAGVVDELRRTGGTSGDLLADAEMLQLVLPVVRADYTAAETYSWVPGPPLRAPIDGLCGDRDPRVAPEDLRGWAAHTTGGFTLRSVPGDHFYFGADPSPVVSLVRERLAA